MVEKKDKDKITTWLEEEEDFWYTHQDHGRKYRYNWTPTWVLHLWQWAKFPWYKQFQPITTKFRAGAKFSKLTDTVLGMIGMWCYSLQFLQTARMHQELVGKGLNFISVERDGENIATVGW
jgi:hypothetical protein